MKWSSRSPDLNIIENVLIVLARNFYAHGTHLKDLRSVVDASSKG